MTATELEKEMIGSWWAYVTWTNVLLILNFCLGLAALEWAWYKTRRFRHPIAELDAQFPELARLDAPKWKKWKLYPGAVTLLIPRAVLAILMALILLIVLNIALIGSDRSRPPNACRRLFIRWTVYIFINAASIFGWFTYLGYGVMTPEQVNYYEEYLGTREEQEHAQSAEVDEDRRVPKRGPGRASTVVCNHIGFMEILNLLACPI